MPTRSPGAQSRPASGVGRILSESASNVLRVVFWSIAIACTLVLAGVGYAFFSSGNSRMSFRAIPAWFGHLSHEQWIALAGGIIVTVLLIVLPCSKIASGGRGRIAGWMGVVAVFLLYGLGMKAAYDVSRALGHSREWAAIHGLYSWAYVGFSLYGWMGEHWKQPVGKTIRQFLAMMK